MHNVCWRALVQDILRNKCMLINCINCQFWKPVLCLLKHCCCDSLPSQGPLLFRTSVSISNTELELKLLCCYIFRELSGSVIPSSSSVCASHSGWGWACCPFPHTIQNHGSSRTKIECDPTGQACISLCCWKSSTSQFCLVLTWEQANVFFVPRSSFGSECCCIHQKKPNKMLMSC